MTKEELIEVYNSVRDDIWLRGYQYGGESISFIAPEKMKEGTIKLHNIRKMELDDRKYEDFPETSIYAENIDFLDKAVEMSRREPETAILNPASAKRAGGGVRTGSRALEEIICRRSNLLESIEKYADPETGLYSPGLYNFELIWSPGVSVYRDSDYEPMPKPVPVNIITMAAVSHPSLNLDLTFTKNQEDTMKGKIRQVFRIAIKTGMVKLVLPAWGCGAFACPAKEVSRVFDEVLKEPEFVGAFNEICFAILDDHNAKREVVNPEGNYKPFLDRFGKKPLSLK